MSGVGLKVREQRKLRGLTISDLALELSIDSGLLSKIERGVRLATRKQIEMISVVLSMPQDKLLPIWLSEKLIHELKDEPHALEAMRVAEKEIAYNVSNKRDFIFCEELNTLLKKVDKLKNTWNSSKPFDGDQLDKMLEYFNTNYTFESNKIEGNTLSLQETHLIINEGLTIGGKTMREHLEAINHSEAIEFIHDVVASKEAFTERVLSEIHYLVLKGINKENAGKYRSVPVMVSGSTLVPPQPYLINQKMEEVFEFYYKNSQKLHPVILAAEMHERIVSVHPFIDGNGRTSRLVMNLILLMNGYTTAILKGDAGSRTNYYKALEETRVNNNREIFHLLIVNAAISSLEEHIALT